MKTKFRITTQRQIRREFWDQFPEFYRRRVRRSSGLEYPTDTLVAFADFIDFLARDGVISESLAFRATL